MTETRSYVISVNPGQLPKVVESHWQPGYSKGHKETPNEAVMVALETLDDEIKAKNLLRRQLQALLAGVEEKDIEQYLRDQEESLKEDLKKGTILVLNQDLVIFTGKCNCTVTDFGDHEPHCGFEFIAPVMDIAL